MSKSVGGKISNNPEPRKLPAKGTVPKVGSMPATGVKGGGKGSK